MATTTNFGWTKPTVGGDTGAWGTVLNALFDAVDTSLKTVSDAVTAAAATATAALPKAGGVATGLIDFLSQRSKFTAVGNISGTGTLNLALSDCFTATVTGTVTVAFSGVPAGTVYVQGVLLKLTNGGSAVVTWPASVKWKAGVAPTLTTAGTDLIAFITYDAGATWLAVAVLDIR